MAPVGVGEAIPETVVQPVAVGTDVAVSVDEMGVDADVVGTETFGQVKQLTS